MTSSVYYVPCPRGVEAATEAEIHALGGLQIRRMAGGVRFRGDERVGYAANLWLRSGIRVQDLLLECEVGDRDELYDAVRELDWDDFMHVDQTLAVDASVRDSEELRHSKYAALVVKDAIVDQFRDQAGRRPNVERKTPDLPLKLVVDGPRASLWRNMSGGSLHKRGYREIQVKSPLNEALAAGLLMLSGWDRGSALVDPMCGSGTFVIEAAMLASDRAPGLLRRAFPFESWPDFDASLMQELREEARGRARERLDFPILGADHHPGALDLAKRGARQAGVGRMIHFERSEARDLELRFAPSLIASNPPYGERIGRGSDLVESWQDLGSFLHRAPGARAWVLSGNPQLTKNLGLRASQKLPVMNGPIDCRWIEYEIGDGEHRRREAAPHDADAAAREPSTRPAPAAAPTPATEAVPENAHATSAHPSPWVEHHIGLIDEESEVLDLACGSGRHAKLLVDDGHRVVALDRDLSALGFLAKHKRIEALEVDLEAGGIDAGDANWPFEERRFGGIVVSNYLWRPLLPRIVEALAPGGVLIYETFQRGQETVGRPRNPDFLLRPNELLELCVPTLEVLGYEAGRFEDDELAFRQRICARRPADDANATETASPQA